MFGPQSGWVGWGGGGGGVGGVNERSCFILAYELKPIHEAALETDYFIFKRIHLDLFSCLILRILETRKQVHW